MNFEKHNFNPKIYYLNETEWNIITNISLGWISCSQFGHLVLDEKRRREKDNM